MPDPHSGEPKTGEIQSPGAGVRCQLLPIYSEGAAAPVSPLIMPAEAAWCMMTGDLWGSITLWQYISNSIHDFIFSALPFCSQVQRP